MDGSGKLKTESKARTDANTINLSRVNFIGSAAQDKLTLKESPHPTVLHHLVPKCRPSIPIHYRTLRLLLFHPAVNTHYHTPLMPIAGNTPLIPAVRTGGHEVKFSPVDSHGHHQERPGGGIASC